MASAMIKSLYTDTWSQREDADMRKALLITGIITIVLGVFSLLLAWFFRFGYYNTMDGSSDLYESLWTRMIVLFIAGLVLTVIGIVCFIVRAVNK